jgi:hypothetical protein
MLIACAASSIGNTTVARVERVGILSTYLVSLDGNGIFIRNGILSKSKITNMNMGNGVRITVKLELDNGFRSASFSELKHRVKEFAERKQNLSKKVYICTTGLSKGKGVILEVSIKKKKGITWQSREKWEPLKSELLFMLQQVSTELELPLRGDSPASARPFE